LTDRKDKIERTLILCLTPARVLLYECDALIFRGCSKMSRCKDCECLLIDFPLP